MDKDDIIESFLAKVDQSGSCWLWKGWVKDRRKPYGVFRYKYAHRVAYELFVGKIPDGLLVCHHCDVPRCVKPAHLFLGTNQDNIRDAERKGRLYHATGPEFSKVMSAVTKGERNGRAKLTAVQVARIRERIAEGERPIDLAREYGVTPGMIGHIKHGRSWT